MNPMIYNSLIVETSNQITTITINRPKKYNALNREVKSELLDALDKLEKDNNVKIIIITGAGKKAFVSGDDVAEFAQRTQSDFELLQQLTLKIENLKKPIIAAINGYALGGGCEIALACDFRIATETSKFGFPEIELGIIPGAGGTQRLPKLIGKTKALELIMTGEFIDAKIAKEIGLINYSVKTEEFNEFIRKFAEKLLEKSQIALELAKQAISYSFNADIKSGLKKELDFIWQLKNTEESKKRVDVFLKKKIKS